MPSAAEPAAFAAAGCCRPLQPARHSMTIQTGRSALLLTTLTVGK
jgi:hypothetical protein